MTVTIHIVDEQNSTVIYKNLIIIWWNVNVHLPPIATVNVGAQQLVIGLEVFPIIDQSYNIINKSFTYLLYS